MSAHISKETAVRIRALLKGGFTQAEIAAECGVAPTTVARQAALLETFTKWRRRSLGDQLHESARNAIAKSKSASLQYAKRGWEFNESNLDLCDIFETPRSPQQIARALRGQE